MERQVNALRRLGGEAQVEHQALPDQIEAVPKIAAGMSERDWPERAQGKTPQGAEEILEGVSTQLGKQLKERLASFRAELKLKREQAANGIAESFQSKLFEALSVFEPSPESRPSSAEATSPNALGETHSPASSVASLLPGESGGLGVLEASPSPWTRLRPPTLAR